MQLNLLSRRQYCSPESVMQEVDESSQPTCSSAPMPQARDHEVCRGCQHLFSFYSGMQAAGGLS